MHTTPINNGCYYIVILSVTRRYDLRTFEFYGIYEFLILTHTLTSYYYYCCVGACTSVHSRQWHRVIIYLGIHDDRDRMLVYILYSLFAPVNLNARAVE